MRKSNTLSIKEAMSEYMEHHSLTQKMAQMDIINSWKDIVGKTIADATDKVYISKKTLFVHLNSSIVRNELFMHRQQLLKTINGRVNQRIINQIVLK